MQLLYHPSLCPLLFQRGVVLSAGNFDGVHLGHQALLKRLVDQARSMGLPSLVVLFEPQPLEFFSGIDYAPARLSTLREKLALLRAFSIDYVYCMRFNHTLASMHAQDFARQWFLDTFHVKYLLVGPDFHFGYQREGNVGLLKAMDGMQNVEICVQPEYHLDGTPVRSTYIRDKLYQGDMAGASRLLGRFYSILGRVVRGDGLGRQWGIPTANVALGRVTCALSGVFVVRVGIAGHWYEGVANIGTRPTVAGQQERLEVHIFDFSQDIYTMRIEVQFLHKLRHEMPFHSLEALIQQIHVDIADARAFLSASHTM